MAHKNKLCYVTAFLNIGRDNWGKFSRTSDMYINYFTHLFNSFYNMDKTICDNYELIVYMDENYINRLQDSTNSSSKITIIPINDKFMLDNIPVWSRLHRENEIMNSDDYKNKFSHRLLFPENSNPKYTLINHAKIDFISNAIDRYPNIDYFCWVDFGYFQEIKRIPSLPINIELLDKTQIN